jgi:hypothetical protein
MVPLARFELATPDFVGRCSDPDELQRRVYGFDGGAPSRTRTGTSFDNRF